MIQEEQLDLTSQEIASFRRAFKDKKFRNAFSDYVTEISNPNARLETEAYIQQLEKQKLPGGSQIVRPNGWIALKIKMPTNQKVFLNVCTHKMISPHKQKNKKTVLPHVLTKGRYEYDRNKSKCLTYDLIVNPKAKHNSKCQAFMQFLVEMAVGAALEAAKNDLRLCHNLSIKEVVYIKMKKRKCFGKKPAVVVIPQQTDTQTDTNPNRVVDGTPKINLNVTEPKYLFTFQKKIDLTDCLQVNGIVLPGSKVILKLVVQLPGVRSRNEIDIDLEPGHVMVQSSPGSNKLQSRFLLKKRLPYLVNVDKARAIFDCQDCKVTLFLPKMISTVAQNPESTPNIAACSQSKTKIAYSCGIGENGTQTLPREDQNIKRTRDTEEKLSRRLNSSEFKTQSSEFSKMSESAQRARELGASSSITDINIKNGSSHKSSDSSGALLGVLAQNQCEVKDSYLEESKALGNLV